MKTILKSLKTFVFTMFIAVVVLGLFGCGPIAPTCTHTFGEWDVTKEATCIETGSQERHCSKCGEVETEELEALGHTKSEPDGDCTTPTLCTNCGEVLEPANEKHVGEDATCTTAGTCLECGMEYFDLSNHAGDEIWVKHLENHYQVYNCCYEQITEPEAHKIENGACTVCGYQPAIIISSVAVKPGETDVTVAVSIKDNPGILGLSLQLEYDSNALLLTNSENGAALESLIFTAPAEYKNGCKFLWDGIEIIDKEILDGDILILTFDVLPSAKPGEYKISLNVHAYDNDLNPFTVVVEGGNIAISK